MTTQTQATETINFQQLAIWTAVAGVASAIVNAIVYFLTQGMFEGVVIPGPGGDMAFSVAPVIGSSIMFIAVGGIVMAVISRFNSRPITTWRNVAIVALVLSFLQPLLLLDASLAPKMVLIVMHIIAGAITIYLLTTRVQADS